MSSPFKRVAQLGLASALTVVAGLSSGCTAANAQLADQESHKITNRVEELERANSQLQLRLDAYEASVTLIEDQVYALELIQKRGDRRNELATVRVQPEVETEVYHTGRGHSGRQLIREPEPVANDGSIEIVVSDDKLAHYFGAPAPTAAPSTASTGGGGARPKAKTRTPQPSVVHGDSLPVNPGAANAKKYADPIDLYKAGLKHYRQEQFEPAIELFEKFLAANPPKDYVDNALYWLGECHYGLGQYAEAAKRFHSIVQDHPSANKVPDALLKVGLTYVRLDKPDSAREVMYYLIEAYPKTEAARVAKQRLDNMNAS